MPPKKRIDRYELMGLLGRGGTGRVYHAWDTKLEREVALKLVTQATDAKIRERFHREVCAIAALRHPNIVEIYDYSGLDTEHLYYVMERLDGDDLFNLLQAHGPVPEPAAAVVGHELCLALSFMHEAGIIHRDLKPENVFVNAQGRVVLTDFGVVKALRHNSAVDGFQDQTDIVGTPGFMPPELLASKALGPYTDVFSLGACLYNIVTGELPYAATSPLELHDCIQRGVVVDPREYNPQVSETLWQCLSQCLAAKPKDRPTVGATREQLKLVLNAYGVSDLRDELQSYMRNIGLYGESARQRAARRLVRELAAAEETADHDRAAALQERLMQVDPDGRESTPEPPFGEDEGPPLPQLEPQARPQPHLRHRSMIAVGLSLLMLAVVGLSVSGQWRVLVAKACSALDCAGQGSSAVAGVTGAALVDADSGGLLEVRVNGPASVNVAGEPLSARDLHGKVLAPGRYRVEVIGGRQRLSLSVDVVAGRHVLVSADLRRGQIQVE